MPRNIMLTALFTLVILPAFAASGSSFTPEQRQQIGNIARDYLLAHPEILDQMLQQRQRQRNETLLLLKRNVIALHHSLLASHDAPQIGPPDAAVVVVSFYDYRCVPCSAMSTVIMQMMRDNPQVRFVFRDWPMPGEGWASSETASAIGVALWQQQGAAEWLRYYQSMFKDHLQVEDIAHVVRTLQVAVPSQSAVTKARRVLDNNAQLAHKLKLGNLPTVIVMPLQGGAEENTSVFISAVSAGELQAAIVRSVGGQTPGNE
jgi:protein-disulfide isomerase